MKKGRTFITILTVIFFGLVIYFLSKTLSDINWNEVLGALKNLHWSIIFFALLGVVVNYIILSSYDFLGLRYLGIKMLSYPKVLWSACVCYIFNLNLGALIGGVGLRFRIYKGWNVPTDKIPQIYLFSLVTNWTGYVVLLSLLFCIRPQEVEKLIHFSSTWIRSLGVLGLGFVGIYFFLCHRRFEINFKQYHFKLPGIKLASVQLVLASLQWMILSALITMILYGLSAPVKYGDVLFTYLMASIAGAMTHIPGGLGVLEAVFLRMNFGVSKHDMIVALICFRTIYFVIPLLLGIPGYFALELFQKSTTRRREYLPGP